MLYLAKHYYHPIFSRECFIIFLNGYILPWYSFFTPKNKRSLSFKVWSLTDSGILRNQSWTSTTVRLSIPSNTSSSYRLRAFGANEVNFEVELVYGYPWASRFLIATPALFPWGNSSSYRDLKFPIAFLCRIYECLVPGLI